MRFLSFWSQSGCFEPLLRASSQALGLRVPATIFCFGNFPASSWSSRSYLDLFHDFGNFASVVRQCNLREMSNTDSSQEKTKQGTSPWKENPSLAAQESVACDAPRKSRYPEMQSAVRFPIKLPISVRSKSGESRTETQNISANGVLFQLVDVDMPVGSPVDFTISLPAEVLGAAVDVRLDCKGRVVRNFEEAGRHGVGVVIDEYRFDRR
jgi:PilZ domain-containing protein